MKCRMKIVLVHFQPPEYYPPLVNICKYLSKKINQSDVFLFTNSIDSELIADTTLKNFRNIFKFKADDTRIIRMFKAIYFNLYVAIQLFRLKPSTVLYFETSSAFPAFLYFLFYPGKARLFVHYHEYTSLQQYKQGMLLDRIWHFCETNFLYKKAYWISQTNKYRCEMFLKDYPFVDPKLLRALPNFPPQSWITNEYSVKQRMKTPPFRIIQIGSISMKHMYAKELFDWIEKMKGHFTLDIYTFSLQADIVTYLQELRCPFIQIKGSIPYSQIPNILGNYDIGVILYRANSENVIYCASNKLFEYLAGGLDVWVSKVMLGSADYIRFNDFPKVSFVDFESLDELDWEGLIDRENLSFAPSEYFMERIYCQLSEHFL